MRVFVAGASGAIGTRLVPQLIDAGHEVIGTHNSPASAELLRTLGAEPVLLDLLDARAVRKAVLESEPEAIVHEATALANVKFGRNFDKAFAKTNRAADEGHRRAAGGRARGGRAPVRRPELRHLPVRPRGRAGQDRGRSTRPHATAGDAADLARRWPSRRGGHRLRRDRSSLRRLLRRRQRRLVEPVRKRQFPIVGDGGGVFSWIHLDDAAAATVLALEHDGPAIYNIVDDEPAPVREWLPVLAEAARRQAAPPLPALARAAVRGRGSSGDGYRGPRRLEREGQARARLDAALPELAPGVRGRLLATHRRRRIHAPPRPTDKPVARLARSPPVRHLPAPHVRPRPRGRPIAETERTREETDDRPLDPR